MASNASEVADLPKTDPGPDNPQTGLQTVGEALASQVGDEGLDAFLEAVANPPSESEPTEAEVAQPPAEASEEPVHSQTAPESEEHLAPGVQKRLDRLYARARAAEEKLAKLEGQLREQPPPEPTLGPTPEDPVEALPNVRELRANEQKKGDFLAQIRAWQRELRRNPETVITELRKVVRLRSEDPDDVADYLTDTADRVQADLAELRGQRQATVVQERGKIESARRHFDQLALAQWNWLREPESEAYQLAQSIAANRPWLKREAAYLPMLALATEWLLGLKKPAAPRPTPRAPGVRPPPPSAAIPGRPAGRESRIAAAEKAVADNPSDQTLTEYLEAQFGD